MPVLHNSLLVKADLVAWVHHARPCSAKSGAASTSKLDRIDRMLADPGGIWGDPVMASIKPNLWEVSTTHGADVVWCN